MSVYDLADMARLIWARSWRWVLWTPRRLGAVVVAVAAIVVGWTQITDSGSGLPSGDTDSTYTADDLPPGWEDWQVVTANPESDADLVEPVEPASTTQAEPETTSEPKPEHDDADDQPAHEPPSKKTKAEATKAAMSFALAYAHTERPQKAWYAKVAPRVVEQLRKPLKTVNPKNITAKKLTGKAKIDSLGEMGGRIVVPTDGGPLVLGVTNTGSRWAVSKVDPPKRTTSPK